MILCQIRITDRESHAPTYLYRWHCRHLDAIFVPASWLLPSWERLELKQPVPRRQHREPLPEQRPKPGSEDPDAPAKIKAIIASPSHRQADQDPDFLRRDDMRGVRLLLDYQKPQTLLAEHDVAHTIVVFGSTRIPEPASAAARASQLRRAVAGSGMRVLPKTTIVCATSCSASNVCGF